MKNIYIGRWIILFLSILFFTALPAQDKPVQPEPVLRLRKVQMPLDWYRQQAELWRMHNLGKGDVKSSLQIQIISLSS